MIAKKQITILFILACIVFIGIAAVKHPSTKHKNLKILPQDISEKKLDSIMESYSKALGVDCKFCHVPVNEDSIDFVSDKEPMKENAREMMRMTIGVNKTYFYFNKEEKPEYLTTVNCMTCHRGEAIPQH